MQAAWSALIPGNKDKGKVCATILCFFQQSIVMVQDAVAVQGEHTCGMLMPQPSLHRAAFDEGLTLTLPRGYQIVTTAQAIVYGKPVHALEFSIINTNVI